MKTYAEKFYKSQIWRRTQQAYLKSVGGLCEICKDQGIIKPGVIVHHKVHITPENIGDPDVTLNWENLQLVCRECHADIHTRGQKRYRVDDLGRVTGIPQSEKI